MSETTEMIKEFNKGDLLYIDEDRKAYWGFPNGYPYKEVTVVNEPLNMAWDYDWAEHLDSAQKVNGIFGKVSNLALTDEQIKGITVVRTSTSGGGVTTYALSDCWEATANMEAGFIRDGSCVLFDTNGDGILLAFVRDADTADFTDPLRIAFTEPGIYLNINHYGYISSLTTTEPIEQRTETIHLIAPEFLPQATTTTLGTVKQMSYLPNATDDAPTAENFNQLVRGLKSAGLMRRS